MKLDIPICLIDESVVDYGFRVLMSGYQPETFAKNPVLLLQHARAGESMLNGLTSQTVLPLGKWNDVKVQGDKLVAYPEFDDDDDDAVKVGNKVKKGYYNAASVWVVPVEVSDDEKLMLPGQYGPTFTKWYIREASIVDIPGCKNAVAIRNGAGKKITLNGDNAEDAKSINEYLKTFLKSNSIYMDNKILAAQLGLNTNADDNAISEKLAALNNSASQLTALTGENTKLKGDVAAKDTEITNLKTAAETARIESLVQGAVDAKKIGAGEKENWKKLAAADYATTKATLDAMKGYESIESKLSTGGEGIIPGADAEVAELMKLSGSDLYMQDKFPRLQALSPEHFKLKYKEYYGHDYTA